MFGTSANRSIITRDSKKLVTDLGVTLRNTQDRNIIEAITKPQKFIADRAISIKGLFEGGLDIPEWDSESGKEVTVKSKGAVSENYKENVTRLLKMGVPEEIAQEIATNAARKMYESELEILNIQWPGAYEKAYGIAQLGNDQKAIVSNIAESDIQRYKSEGIREYKERKRMKKLK